MRVRNSGRGSVGAGVMCVMCRVISCRRTGFHWALMCWDVCCDELMLNSY